MSVCSVYLDKDITWRWVIEQGIVLYGSWYIRKRAPLFGAKLLDKIFS